MINDGSCNVVECENIVAFTIHTGWSNRYDNYCAFHWAEWFKSNPEFYAIVTTEQWAKDVDRLTNERNDAPWRDGHPGPKMEIMKTRDGADQIEWCHASNDGNLDACWVIYRPGDEFPAILDSDPYPWKDYS